MAVQGNDSDDGSTAATYQAIIIALVAGGILSSGAVSIIYRRRRRQRLARAAQRGMRMIILPDGRVFEVRDGGNVDDVTAVGGSLKFGREPGIWDALVGEEEEPEREERVDEGVGEGEWNPISLAFPPSPPPGPTSIGSADPPDSSVEMTVLVAMPTPHAVCPSRPSSPSASSSSPSFHKPHTHFPTLYHLDPDLGELPPVEIATTIVPVSLSGDAGRRALGKLKKEAMVRNCGDQMTPSRGGIRYERTDGFTSTT